jgi:hypothetical protein
MAKTVLVLGRNTGVVEDARRRLRLTDERILAGTGVDDVRAALAEGRIDHVIMGAGLDLDIRVEIIREIFQSSDTTTVHMKDSASGPEGFLPFIQSVLDGLDRRARHR